MGLEHTTLDSTQFFYVHFPRLESQWSGQQFCATSGQTKSSVDMENYEGRKIGVGEDTKCRKVVKK